MKANTSYKDVIGTACATITDRTAHNDLDSLADYIKLDKARFDLVGLILDGPGDFTLSFLCVDKAKSTEEKEHIVKIMYDEEHGDILSILFKHLQIVLYDQYDKKYLEMNYAEETRWSDYNV